MKIGIITLPLHINHGGVLQNFALQKVLKDMGHKVFTIEIEKEYLLPLKKRYLAYIKRILKRFILRQPCEIFFEKNENERYKIISSEIHPFIKQYIQIKQYNQFSSIKKDEYDAIIVGSDQVWRPRYFKDIKNAFLAFAQQWNIIRIAYAASFGTDKWEYNTLQTQECQKLISHFDAVSVRELQGKLLCKKYFHTDALHALDPTLLIKKEDYIEIFTNENTPKSKGNLLVYLLDKDIEKENIVNEIAIEKKLIPFYVNNTNVYNRNISTKDRIQPGISQWLRGFYDAEFIITDSFHACVFSIIFQKPFVVYGNIDRGLSRFTSLLSLFHLENRMVHNIDELQNVLKNDINWTEINTILKEKQKESLDFLRSHLSIKK